MTFTQISQQHGQLRRVPRDEEPVVELDIPEGGYVSDVRIKEAPWMFHAGDRRTVDYFWTVTIVHPLGPVE